MSRALYYGGTIITMEDSECYTESVMTENGLITEVGDYEQLKKFADNNTVLIDLKGKTMLPAFIDAHSHFSAYANSLLQVSLNEATDTEEIIQRIQSFIRKNHIPSGQWVIAKGYEHNSLKDKKHPDRRILDKASPDNPLVIQHQSGHAGVFNTEALNRLSINLQTPSPSGGRIEVINGRLTGYLEENAFISYLKQIPVPPVSALLSAYETAQKQYASYGIATVQEGMMIDQLIPLYQALLKSDLLKLDLVGYADIYNSEQLFSCFSGHIGQYQNHFKLGGYKIFLDGSPQARTAWMRTPYRSRKSEKYFGYNTMSSGEVIKCVQTAIDRQHQILAHCNGDAACEQYIQAFQQTGASPDSIKAIRPVMIHAQLLGTDQMEDIKKWSIIPSFFIAHVYHWGDTHIYNFGRKRADKISPAKSAQDNGILFTFHQDAPVIEPDMLETIWCASSRTTKSGELLGKEERIPVYEALKAITIHGAYQYFEENEKGSIAPGKRADFVILDRNPLETEIENLRSIQILETIKDGEIIYQKNI